MRLATIDLGTNTVRLLIVDVSPAGGWRTIVQDQRVTRLGEGLTASGRLGHAPMERTALTVAEYAQRAHAAGAGAVRIVATSAVREAANGRDFAAAVERATGHAVEVISGDDEARLTIRGIVAGLDVSPETLLAFDIGGGSTEYILARAGRVETARRTLSVSRARGERSIPADGTGDQRSPARRASSRLAGLRCA